MMVLILIVINGRVGGNPEVKKRVWVRILRKHNVNVKLKEVKNLNHQRDVWLVKNLNDQRKHHVNVKNIRRKKQEKDKFLFTN
jgi:hypothetical protein